MGTQRLFGWRPGRQRRREANVIGTDLEAINAVGSAARVCTRAPLIRQQYQSGSGEDIGQAARGTVKAGVGVSIPLSRLVQGVESGLSGHHTTIP